ncbi:kelch-like protein 38 [Betta splendens]|uniref:Kelch-like protein 38 n=1 Tax=Betta splendens TaxID=158456 RepID=A0A6P7NVY5_BETSP|nr:kelch-like protein 38 [Betta splendens]
MYTVASWRAPQSLTGKPHPLPVSEPFTRPGSADVLSGLCLIRSEATVSSEQENGPRSPSGTVSFPPACWNVLVSSSPYFRAMFCRDFPESSQARVNLKGVSPDALSGIVDYVYTGCISITMEVVLPLMQAASTLHYGGLFEACSSLLKEQLSPENCLSMMRLSEILPCESLKERARDVIYDDVIKCENLEERRPQRPQPLAAADGTST